jgi:hypothetical protein
MAAIKRLLGAPPEPRFVADQVHIETYARGRQDGILAALALVQQLQTDDKIAGENDQLRHTASKAVELEDHLKALAIHQKQAEDYLYEVLRRIRHEIDRRSWIGRGRGSYHYDDDRYRHEVNDAFDAMVKIIDPAIARLNHGCRRLWDNDALTMALLKEMRTDLSKFWGIPHDLMHEKPRSFVVPTRKP